VKHDELVAVERSGFSEQARKNKLQESGLAAGDGQRQPELEPFAPEYGANLIHDLRQVERFRPA